jgi:hypothetical protein
MRQTKFEANGCGCTIFVVGCMIYTLVSFFIWLFN